MQAGPSVDGALTGGLPSRAAAGPLGVSAGQLMHTNRGSRGLLKRLQYCCHPLDSVKEPTFVALLLHDTSEFHVIIIRPIGLIIAAINVQEKYLY